MRYKLKLDQYHQSLHFLVHLVRLYLYSIKQFKYPIKTHDYRLPIHGELITDEFKRKKP